MKHYHYHITYHSNGQRIFDTVPYTSEEVAKDLMARLFTKEERPQVIKVDATKTCGGSCQ